MVNVNSRNFHLSLYPSQKAAKEIVTKAGPLYLDESAWTKMESAMTGSLSILH